MPGRRQNAADSAGRSHSCVVDEADRPGNDRRLAQPPACRRQQPPPRTRGGAPHARRRRRLRSPPLACGKIMSVPQAAQRPALRAASRGFASPPRPFSALVPPTGVVSFSHRPGDTRSSRGSRQVLAPGVLLLLHAREGLPALSLSPCRLTPRLTAALRSQETCARRSRRRPLQRDSSSTWAGASVRMACSTCTCPAPQRVIPKPGCEGNALAASGHIAVRPRAAGQVSYGGAAAANASAGRPRGRNFAASCRSSEWGVGKSYHSPQDEMGGPTGGLTSAAPATHPTLRPSTGPLALSTSRRRGYRPIETA